MGPMVKQEFYRFFHFTHLTFNLLPPTFSSWAFEKVYPALSGLEKPKKIWPGPCFRLAKRNLNQYLRGYAKFNIFLYRRSGGTHHGLHQQHPARK
jgi:hypothetical protein